LDVYYKFGKEKSVLYEDAQDGYDYNKGRFSFENIFNLDRKRERASLFSYIKKERF
jgi:alpha-glucosidase